MPSSPLARLRKLCLALPEAHEVEAWGEPTFRVRNKLFAMYADAHNHHGAGRAAVWCKAAPGNQELMVRAAPDRFFVPAYVGPSGWVGIWLDDHADWRELAGLLQDSYRLVAPKRLLEGVGRLSGRGARETEPAKKPPRKPPAPRRARSGRSVSWEDVCRWRLALPGMQQGTCYGTAALYVGKKLLSRRKEDGDSIVMRTDLVSRPFLLRADPETYFLTDHYRDYPWILVRLSRARPAQVQELLEEGWRRLATKRMLAARPSSGG